MVRVTVRHETYPIAAAHSHRKQTDSVEPHHSGIYWASEPCAEWWRYDRSIGGDWILVIRWDLSSEGGHDQHGQLAVLRMIWNIRKELRYIRYARQLGQGLRFAIPLHSSTIVVNGYLAYSLKKGDASGSGKHCGQGPADSAAKRTIQLPSLHL